MDVNEHEGILAIFLSEAEGIVEGLFAQLEELQYGYDGQRILDDIHRGFHTLYGGSAVLELVELAECAQLAERVLDRLRMRRLSLSPSLVSLIVGAASAIEAMLARLIEHQAVRPIPEELKLRLLRACGQEGEPASEPVRAVVERDPLAHFFGSGRQEELRVQGKSSEAPGLAALDQMLKGYSARAAQSAVTSTNAAALDMLAEPRLVDGGSNPAPLQIRDLVNELSWVRNRLMGFQRESGSDTLNKSLAYLDLVTRDMEQWLEQDHLKD